MSAPAAKPAVSVVVPARDAATTIAATLQGLREQRDAPEFEVIVVDDGSRDATREIAAGYGAHVIDGAARGPAHARNAGAAIARAPLLAFLDADCRPSPDWLCIGCAALEYADYAQGATAPDPDVQPGPFDRTLRVTCASGLYESANVFVTKQLFDQLGGFHGWLGPRRGKELGEDVWFGWRARRAGARMSFAAGATAHHAVFPRGPGSFVAERLRLRFFPAMARRIPELRSVAFYRRWFITRRSAAFSVAVAGIGVSRLTRRRWPLLASVPYCREAGAQAGAWGWRRAPLVFGVGLAADVVALAALVVGSARHRAPLL
jgi:hypothetical protein